MEGILVQQIVDYGVIIDKRKEIVTLNETELDIAKFLGEKKSKIGRNQVKFVDDNWEKHYLAYCGEIAFCKIMNICFSPIIDASHNWSNDKGDAFWGGLKVDVKHSIYDTATLAVQEYAINADVDIYVLVTGKPPTFKYQGGIFKKDLIIPTNLGNGPRGFENAYCVSSNHLKYYWWRRIKDK